MEYAATQRRRWVKWLAAPLALTTIVFLVHTPWVKSWVKDFARRTLESRVGGDFHIAQLDYRLWLGEARATGVRWTSADDVISVRVAELFVALSWTEPTSIVVREPEARIRETATAPAPVNVNVAFEIPAWLLESKMRATDGRLYLAGLADPWLELDGIDATLDPIGGFWEGSASSASGRLSWDGRSLAVGSATAKLRLHPNRVELFDGRLERDGSFIAFDVNVNVELGSLSPARSASIDATLNHSLDTALVRELVPDFSIIGRLEGVAEFHRDNEAWLGDGVLESDRIALPPVAPVAIRAPWTFASSVFRLDDAFVSGYGGEARVSAEWDLDADTQKLTATFEGLELASAVASRIGGTASVTLREWDFDSAQGRADVELRPVGSTESFFLPMGGQVTLELDGRTLRVDAPTLSAPGLELSVSGDVGERLDLQYVATLTDVTKLDLLPTNLAIAGRGVIEGRVDGTLRRPRVTAMLSSDSLSFGGLETELEGGLLFEGDRIELESLFLRQAPDRTLMLQGSFDIVSETLSVRGHSAGFALDILPGLDGTAGAIAIELDGPLRALAGRATATIETLRYREVALPVATLHVDIEPTYARLTARSAGGIEVLSARVETRAPYATEAALSLDELPLSELLRTFADHATTEPDLHLDIDGDLFAFGELAEPASFRYRVEGEQVVGSYHGVGFGVGASFMLEGDRDTLTVHDLTLVGADTAIGIDGSVPLSAEGTWDLVAEGVARLELLDWLFPEADLAGRAELSIRASGDGAMPDLDGMITIFDASARVSGVVVEGGVARLRFRGDTVLLDELGGEMVLDASSSEGGIATPDRIGISLSGELTGASLEPSAWHGSGHIDRVQVTVVSSTLDNTERAPWTLDEGELRLPELSLEGSGSRITLDGTLRPWAEPLEWSARARGLVDAVFLSRTLAELGMSLTGMTELELTASEGETPLTIAGTASVRDGRLSVREPALTFTNVSADLQLSNNAVTLSHFDASVGGGDVRGEGEVRLDGATIGTVDLRARARSVRLSYPEGLRSELDGELRLLGEPGALQLTGDIGVARAIFSRDISLETELLQSMSRARPLPSTESWSSQIKLDIRVRTIGDLRIDNNLARLRASASLVLGGTVAEPELVGTVSARPGGEFRLGRNRYRIESGRIELARYPVEPPALHITARTTVSDYDISMRVSGPVNELSTELSGFSRRNRAELTSSDAASLLVTGRTVDRVSAEGRAILGEQMASFVGATLADLTELGLGNTLPFRLVTVEPDLISDEADPSARFTLGAALTEDMSVVYSVGLNDAEKQIWIVDYNLPRRARTQLIRQDDNEFTGALSQQLQFGQSRASSLTSESRLELSRVGFYFVSGEPNELESAARSELGLEEGERFDYWRAWERAERLRDWLRDDSFLEATVDLSTTPCGSGCIELDVFVVTGKRIRFVWSGDATPDSVSQALVTSWSGYLAPSFLVSELALRAERELFTHGYYLARVEVDVFEHDTETVVSIGVVTGPHGSRVQVDVVGNTAVADAPLVADLPPLSSASFHELITTKRPRLAQILEMRYASLGYLQAEIGAPSPGFDAASGVLTVEIPVIEGELSIVSEVELDGAERVAINESALRSRISLEKGAPFRLTDFVKDRSSIASYYRTQGFPDVEVDAVVEEDGVPGYLRARFIIKEGPEVAIGTIHVVGNDTTREKIIRRELTLETGQPLRPADVQETQRRLYELGIFRSADVVVVGVSESNGDAAIRDVVVEVTEVPKATLDYGVRFTTDGFFEVLADVEAPNLFGSAQGAGFRALLGTERRIFRFTYHTPYFARYKLDTNFFVERVFEEQFDTIEITEDSWRFTAQQNRRLRRSLNLQWSYSFKRIVTAFEDLFLGPISFSQKQSLFTTALVGDYRDNVIQPTRGSFWSVTVQGAPLFFGSDFKLVKIFAQAFTFLRLGRDIVWAAGYRAGAIDSFGQILLEDDRFQVGGPNSVRGFEQGALGPRDPLTNEPLGGAGVLIFNQEIRFPIVWRLRGVGFYDTGNAFERPSDIRLSDLRHSAGAGVRLELPFGLLRFDWARVLGRREDETPWRFIFSLGHAF